MAKPVTAPTPAAGGRLAGKIAVVTGAAGNLGGHIVRHYLAEGATVVMTGRTPARTNAAADAIRAETGGDGTRLATVALDGGDPESVRKGIADVVARFGRIDILVNNAGSAGPKQPLEQLPLDAGELAALQKAGATDSETVGDAIRNIFGVAWNVSRAAAKAMGEGGSIINVSTIFSRTLYYARTAYVVPKAAMNAFSRELSLELGPRGIRVNLVFPGPIESERIRSVFAHDGYHARRRRRRHRRPVLRHDVAGTIDRRQPEGQDVPDARRHRHDMRLPRERRFGRLQRP